MSYGLITAKDDGSMTIEVSPDLLTYNGATIPWHPALDGERLYSSDFDYLLWPDDRRLVRGRWKFCRPSTRASRDKRHRHFLRPNGRPKHR